MKVLIISEDERIALIDMLADRLSMIRAYACDSRIRDLERILGKVKNEDIKSQLV